MNPWLEVSIRGEEWTAMRKYKGQQMPTLAVSVHNREVPVSHVGDRNSDGTLALKAWGVRVRKRKATVEGSECREAVLQSFHL